MITAVTSFTDNPKYDFFIPIIKWGWEQLGVNCHFIVPSRIKHTDRFSLIQKYTQFSFYSSFTAAIHKEITYAQVGRLFLGDMYDDSDVLITTDADMLVLKLPPQEDSFFNILGTDLVPPSQFPMCYVSAKASLWKQFLNRYKSFQDNLDSLLGHIECDSFAGNYWAFDQEHLWNSIIDYAPINFIPRARPGTQFASNRCDRDDINWRSYLGPNLVDAHLWRPGFEENNFANIMELLQTQYPEDNFQWLIDFRQQYIQLL